MESFLAYAVFFPALVALIKIWNASPQYRPILTLLILAGITELISSVGKFFSFRNDLVYNVYTILESILFVICFHYWGVISRKWAGALLVLNLLVWCWDMYSVSISTTLVSHHTTVAAMINIFLCILVVNSFILSNERKLLKHPKVLICLTLIMMYTYIVLTELFWRYGQSFSDNFLIQVNRIFTYTNFIGSLLLGYAILWIPRKQTFLLSSSS